LDAVQNFDLDLRCNFWFNSATLQLATLEAHMTWCETQVAQFNQDIKLDTARIDRVVGAITRFQEFCKKDDELKAAMADNVFLQGSVATKTTVRPLGDDEFDVDAVYPFNLAAFGAHASPVQILEWFKARLKQSDFYKNKLIARDRCARIDYAGDFHVDIIPATKIMPEHQPYAVPAKDLGSWITNDPLGYVNWVKEIDGRASGIDSDGVGRFVRSCRMMKRWRDATFLSASAPSSIVLVTMLGKHDPSKKEYDPPLSDPLYPKYQTDIAYLYDMLRLTHSCLDAARRSAFMHPTLPKEDLSRGWDEKNLVPFMTKLQTCIDNLKLGIYSQDEKASLKHYKDAFGDTFPAS